MGVGGQTGLGTYPVRWAWGRNPCDRWVREERGTVNGKGVSHTGHTGRSGKLSDSL